MESGRPAKEMLRQVLALQWQHWAGLIREVFAEWMEDKAPRLGAALAFYTALSLAPLLVVVLAVAGMVYGQRAAEGQLVWQIQDTVGPEGAKAIQALISTAHKPASGAIATTLGLMALFFGASSAVVELIDDLNTIWNVPVDPRKSNVYAIFSMIKRRAFSFGIVLAIGFFLVVSLFVTTALEATENFFRSSLPMPGYALEIVNFLVSFLAATFLFAAVYKVLPNVRLKWSDVAIGAAVTSLLFTIGKFLIGLYLGRTTIASSYGAAGSFLMILVWVYYSAQVFFLGAEFTKIYTLRHGSRFRAKLELVPERFEAPLVLDEPAQPHPASARRME